MSTFMKGVIIGFIYAYVWTMCIGAAVFQIYYGGEGIAIAISALLIASWVTYKKFKEVYANDQV